MEFSMNVFRNKKNVKNVEGIKNVRERFYIYVLCWGPTTWNALSDDLRDPSRNVGECERRHCSHAAITAFSAIDRRRKSIDST